MPRDRLHEGRNEGKEIESRGRGCLIRLVSYLLMLVG